MHSTAQRTLVTALIASPVWLSPVLVSYAPAPAQDCASACTLTTGEDFSGEFTLVLSLTPKESGTACRVFARMYYEPDSSQQGLVGLPPGATSPLALIDHAESGECFLMGDCPYGESTTGWARSGKDGPLLASWTLE
jgi:hypothetical protein